jgi:GTPase SAR1 family protein
VTDTGSVERFRGSIPTNYFRHSQGVVLVHDLTDPTTLYDLEDWMTDAYNKVPEGSVIDYVLIGNKLDEVGTGMDLESLDDGKCFAERHNIPEELQYKIAAEEDTKESLRAIFKTIALHIHTTQTVIVEDQESSIEAGTPSIVLTEHKETEDPQKEGNGCFRC